jgi:hypothetical protein
MATLVLWWGGILLEALIIARMWKNRVLRSYPFFGVYLGCVLFSSSSGYILSIMKPSAYTYWYWGWEFVCVLAGYCVVLELLENALASNAGPRKLARNAALLVFASVVGVTAFQWGVERGLHLISTSIEVERNLRTAELVLLAFIIGVILYYGIPVSRNLKGVLLGYGVVVAVVVMANAAASHSGQSFGTVFSMVRSYSYLAALLIWAGALWSYRSNPVPERPTALAADYDALANWTKGVLAGMRDYVRKAPRR